MNKSKNIQQLKNGFDIFPFKFSGVLFLLFAIFVYVYLTNNYEQSEQSTQAIFVAVAKYLLFFVIAIVGISFLSLLISYIVFCVRAKRNKDYVKIALSLQKQNTTKVTSIAKTTIAKLMYPLFGAIKIRFKFDNNYATKKYNLVSKGFNFLISKNFESHTVLDFSDVNNYILESTSFYFEDYFSIFSFRYTCSTNSQFYILPKVDKVFDTKVKPMVQLESNVRSEFVRYTAGEYLRFKNFEDSDDVRRIVWKVYAKSKELVVRSQELRNPYASLVTVYPSFYKNSTFLLSENLSQAFLTCYKNAIWSVFSGLTKDKNISLQLKLDQNINVVPSENLPAEMFEISVAEWQNSISTNDFYKVGNVSVMCISSFAEIDDLKDVLGRANQSTIFVFVSLSKCLNFNAAATVLKNIFIKPKQGSVDELRFKFLSSPMRKTILANEKRILELLKKEANSYYEF